MKNKITIITGDPELENYVSKTPTRYWLDVWASRIDDSVVKYLKKKGEGFNITSVKLKDIDEDVFITSDFVMYNFGDPAAANIISRNISEKLLKLLNEYSYKVYPPIEFGKLVTNKCLYYEKLKQYGIPIVPFFCIESNEYFTVKNDKVSERSFYEEIYQKIKKKQWKGFIGKPVLGTSGIGFRMYPNFDEVSKYEIYNQLQKQMKFVFETKQFPMLLLQEKHEEFGSGDIPEIKMYYLDGKYLYAWVTADNKYVMLGKGEKDSKFYITKEHITHFKKFASKVIKFVKMYFGNKPLPLLRIDLGCCLNHESRHTKGQIFLNEIEYAPAFMLSKIPGKQKLKLDIKIGNQMLKIANDFFKIQKKNINIAILDRDPRIADDKMTFKRAWMPTKNPTSYLYNKYVWSPEVSTYWYIKRFYKNVNIDLVPFEKITDELFMKKYKKVFIINHGLSDITPFWKNKSEEYIKGWKKLGNRASPPYKLAEFVYDKCKYYKYLQENGIVTAPTICYTQNTPNSNINNFIKNHDLKKIFLKPVGGDSGLGTSSHNVPFNNLKPVLTKMMNNGWRKVVVQKHMNFSSSSNPEYKCLFIGNSLQYITKSIKLGIFGGLIKSKNTYFKDKKKLVNMSLKVKELFEKAMDAKILIYRVDWGYNKDTKEYFLNEFEHAPGWYSEDIIHRHSQMTIREWNGDIKLAKEIIKYLFESIESTV